MHKPTDRARFGLWLVLLVLLISAGHWQWRQGLQLETDILALLPQEHRDPLLEKALARSAEQGEGLVLWLLRADTRAAAQQGAGWLDQALEQSGVVMPVEGGAPQGLQALRQYRYLLMPADQRELLLQNPLAWLATKQAALYGPAGWQRARALASDPLYLSGDYLMSLVPEGLAGDGGYPLQCDPGGCNAVLVSRVVGERFDLNAQSELSAAVTALQNEAAGRGWRLLAGGLPLFAAEATAQARNEVSTVGLGSALGVVTLMLLSFRRPRPLLLALAALATGIGAATLVCFALMPPVHWLTLVFGASLVGVAIDYALHWLCARFEDEPESELLKATGLALLTSVLGFGLLALAPFPGLRQIALFSVVGLTGAWLTVVLAFPVLGRGMNLTWRPRLGWPAQLNQAWLGLGRRHWTWLVGAACVLLAGLARLEPNDDLRLLQSVPASQVELYQKLQQAAPMTRDSQFFLVRGADIGSVIATEERLLRELAQQPHALAGGAQALSQHYPKPEQQRRTLAALVQLCRDGRLEQWLSQLGAAGLAATECNRMTQADNEMPLSTWAEAIGPPWGGLWLGCEAGQCASMVALSGVRDLQALRQIGRGIDGVELVDPVSLISSVLSRYRQTASGWLLLALALALPLMMAGLGVVRGIRVALVPVLTVFSVLATLGWLGAPFSLFNLFALLVVGGISVDYAIFNALSGTRTATALAVALAALTTLLAFGLLAVSQTPLVAAFGLTLALGVGFAVLWAPLLAAPARGYGSAVPAKDL